MEKRMDNLNFNPSEALVWREQYNVEVANDAKYTYIRYQNDVNLGPSKKA